MDTPLLADLRSRGLLHDSTDVDALSARLADGPLALYGGFDPTADSLHVGSLVPVLLLRRFQDAGHLPIALTGGATGMIGDPSGKSSERNLLDRSTLATNTAAISDQLARLLPGEVRFRDNADWTAHLSLIDFLRDVGKHFTVNRMVAKESVRARMASEEGISYTEFSYQLLQANDYLQLYDREGCELQVGGSDQWGNITAGVDLVRRVRGVTVHGLSHPLITKADGTKFGKSESGAVWLAAERTSPYRFYQWWMQADDRDLEGYLRVFSLQPLEQLDAVLAEHRSAPEQRHGQRFLAHDVTALVHGEEEAEAAREASEVLFGGAVEATSARALEALAGEVPTCAQPRSVLDAPLSVTELLLACEAVRSRSEARRLLEQGGVYVNNRQVRDDGVDAAQLLHDRWLLLRKGKRDYHLVRVG